MPALPYRPYLHLRINESSRSDHLLHDLPRILALIIPRRRRREYHRAYPLQELAAHSSIGLLKATGVHIESAGGTAMNIISLQGNHHPLQIVEACSGVRSLMAYLALAVALAYLNDRPVWHRVVYVASAVPIAILCNIVRVVITCTMFVLDKPSYGQGFMHEFTGILMLGPAALMFVLVGRALDRLYIEDDEEDETDQGPDKKQAPSASDAAEVSS